MKISLDLTIIDGNAFTLMGAFIKQAKDIDLTGANYATN